MSTNPYEIRLELLKMAKDLLLDEYYSEKQKIVDPWQLETSMASIPSKIPKYPDLPKFPSEQDIIKKAHELNKFISNGHTES